MSGFVRSEADGVSHGARVLIVLPELEDNNKRSTEARLEEATGLACAIGLDVVSKLAFHLRAPKASTLFGPGQVEQIVTAARDEEVDLVIVDGPLTPIQQRNLETSLDVKVIDRTGLILEIFGARAATAEGRLQVELAHLDYQAGRLVRTWTHLERQRGGFGFLGGPGETQIEADRRMIRDRMAKLRRDLAQVTRTRGLHRARRKKAPWPVVALVGYTNAGKSTLFNRMTGADVMAKDLLFATLDPTMRQIALPGIDKAILSDTVGFVSDLPTQLVAAFRATLEEVTAADLILHVRDIAQEDSESEREDVERVLAEIGIAPVEDGGEFAIPVIEAWNKSDLLSEEAHESLAAEAARRDDVALISAWTGEGIEDLRELVSQRLSEAHRLRHIDIPVTEGQAMAWLYAHGDVVSDVMNDETGKMEFDVRMSDENWGRFIERFGFLYQDMSSSEDESEDLHPSL
ncbi:MAG: GTPase HflX [Zymomonas mobilis]|uniref:GTPase HflX n=1 Tax=Zymomonas mobilis subsp. mobilis (strain ATCC 10988 / DSM 424 / LMG 404 / NCIMB 8938 / NRRL B-806 / ZM1) TaxID=555217 RepID=A0A0H3G1S1_ZYMMA|nr:GTPase HflX [Zymomonas mobilis]ACV75436.1 GTP-binding proten HflX [Zymomonas mobilis subsp. mobilis NCIMB 11163]AEH62727.1 GTP-binding proten HflX [Zymomonas mobilis subsp. mobilis ATCC 10988]ART93371.1 GTPase HflX [Zymomonas mobilis subsp. mobilis]MCP9307046.1 GTPase HflX [Zymomonas mobilis]TQL27667.1 GTP-binding protein HflX [Zymomonas mobilis]